MDVNWAEVPEAIQRAIGRLEPYRKKARIVLRLGTSVMNRIPNRTDNPITVGVKVLSILDALDGMAHVAKTREFEDTVEVLGLRPQTSRFFSEMFFRTKLLDEFDIRPIVLDGVTCIEARSKKHGTLLFKKSFESHYEATFYHSPGLDFRDLMQRTWDLYEGRIYCEMGRRIGTDTAFTQFSPTDNPLYGPAGQRMKRMVETHLRYRLDGVPRAYLFYGAPGTGKTSFAQVFADKVGERLLKLDAQGFADFSVADLNFLVECLGPDLIIVDDIDQVTSYQMPRLLDSVQELKLRSHGPSLLMTANTVSGFNLGFLRPGRVDTWVCFDPPDEALRREMLERYLGDLTIAPEIFQSLVLGSEGLTQDYLREIAQRLRYESPEEVVEAVHHMQRLLGNVTLAQKRGAAKAQGQANGSSETNGHAVLHAEAAYESGND